MDDKICMHYIVDRLEDITKAESIELSYEMVLSFKDELVYNLGVNQRIKRNEKGKDNATR
jgi:hypothetical protein